MSWTQRDGEIREARPEDRASIIEVAQRAALFSPAEIADIETTLDLSRIHRRA